MGVRRISVGAALARAAWSGFMQAARAISRDRDSIHLQAAVPGKGAQRAVRTERVDSKG